MSFLGETILVPKHGTIPKVFAFFKVIHGQIKDGTRIKVVHGHDAFIASVYDNRVYPDVLQFEINDGNPTNYLVDTKHFVIIEVDPIPGTILNPNLETVGDHQENVLIQRIRTHPELAKNIPHVLWERPSFQRKIISANLPLEGRYVPDKVKTIARIKRVNKSGTFDTDLPDDMIRKINEMLGIHKRGGRTRRFKK